MLGATVFLVVSLSAIATGFPDGAPVDSCVKPRPNQPYHGQARPQPLSTNPYRLIASTDRYQPGSQITGEYMLFFILLNNKVILSCFCWKFSQLIKLISQQFLTTSVNFIAKLRISSSIYFSLSVIMILCVLVNEVELCTFVIAVYKYFEWE